MRSIHVAIFSVMLLCGCGPKVPDLIQVSGTLTMNGKALDEVQVEIAPDPEKGNVASASRGLTDGSGKFVMNFSNADVTEPGVSPGWVRVVLLDFKLMNSRDEPMDPRFSEDYSLAGSTPIRMELTESTTDLKIDLKDFPATKTE